LKLNLAPHVPDDIVDSVLQQFQPALERPGIKTQWNGRQRRVLAIDGNSFAHHGQGRFQLKRRLSHFQRYFFQLNRTGKNLGGIDQELRLYGSLARKAQQGGNL
jgi:hypothetical protein